MAAELPPGFGPARLQGKFEGKFKRKFKRNFKRKCNGPEGADCTGLRARHGPVPRDRLV